MEEKVIKNQLLRNIMYTLIAFTIIFTIFACIIYNQVNMSVYSDVENELVRYKNTGLNIRRSGVLGEKRPFNNQIAQIISNPRIIFILRDDEGDVINADNIGQIYSEYLTDIAFDKNDIENIYDLQIEDSYYYKGITFENMGENGKTIYIQLLINVDSEANIMNNLLDILIIGTLISILISIIASYILSKKALIPVLSSWKKQIEFTANASHELRSPLTVMQLKQEQLLKEPNATILEKADNVNMTLDEIERMTKLTTDLMTLARADSNTQVLNKEKVNIDELIENIAKPYIELAESQEKKLELNLNFKKNLDIDVSKFKQLMVILLDNAIKYTEAGNLINIETHTKDNHFILELKDTGIGISEEGRKHIFDRFYREDKARSRENRGTGLRTFYCVLDCNCTWRHNKSTQK